MLSMKKEEYMKFYENTLYIYSKPMKAYICQQLLMEHIITYNRQIDIKDTNETIFIERKDPDIVLQKVFSKIENLKLLDKYEMEKLYKYSVPFIYEGDVKTIFDTLLNNKKLIDVNTILYPCKEYNIGTTIKDTLPVIYKKNDIIFIKFVIQKSYINLETFESMDYRYPIILYFDLKNNILEIRYDTIRQSDVKARNYYKQSIDAVIKWLKDCGIKIYGLDDINFLSVLKDNNLENVRIYKQMMNMGNSGKAELTASQEQDYILPFIGELNELINENEELFNSNAATKEIKELLLDYLKEKEITTNYPYVYLKWLNAVSSKSFIVKITFSYFDGKYTLLQHIAADCSDYGMERMNNAIRYLIENKAFIKGKEL